MLLTLLTIWTDAQAHGGGFDIRALSVNPADTQQLWAVVTGWGLMRSPDGGGSWGWLCEEALGVDEVYDVMALEDGSALVGTSDGLWHLDGCDSQRLPEMSTDTQVTRVLRAPDGAALAIGLGLDVGSIWRCTADGCAVSELSGDEIFPKSLSCDRAGDCYATTVLEGSLAASLLRSSDQGRSWEGLASWPDGTIDPRVLYNAGDLVLVWERPREEGAAEPVISRSIDGGQSFESVLVAGYSSDTTMGLVLVPQSGELVVSSPVSARTWRSRDDGRSWEETSTWAPTVACGEWSDEATWACADHLAEGIDAAYTEDGLSWYPIACLEEAVPDACAEEVCAGLYEAYYVAATQYGTGRCDIVLEAPAEEVSKEDEGCRGCAGAPFVLPPLLWGIPRRRRT
jgi:hypothetical protein